MEGFHYSVAYRQGPLNIADYLSRQYDVVAVTTRSRDQTERVNYADLNRGTKSLKPIIGGKEGDKASYGYIQASRTTKGNSKEAGYPPARGPVRMSEEVNGNPPVRGPMKKNGKGTGYPPARGPVEMSEEVNGNPPVRGPMKKKMNREPIVKKNITTPIDVEHLIDEQSKDKNVQKLWKIAMHEYQGEISEQERVDAENVRKSGGVIVKDVRRATGDIHARVVVPKSLQERIVEEIHRLSHAGITGTYHMLQQDHWFRGMKPLIKHIVKHCPECIAIKGRPLTPEVMAPDIRPLALGDRWHIDGLYLGPSLGYDHLMVATDVATKYVVLTRAKGETAEAASDILMEISSRFGRPRQVTTDRGRDFISRLFMTVCGNLFIDFKPVAVKQPQANGMVERVNKTVLHIIQAFCNGDKTKWAPYVRETEYAVNTRISSVTRFTPYELVYGRLPPGPVYLDPVRKEEEERSKGLEDEGVTILKNRIKILQYFAHRNQMKAAKQQQSYHDAYSKAHTFNVNDDVWLYKQTTVKGGATSKLKYNWRGPYKIERVIGPVTYTLKDTDGNTLPGTHHARQLYKVDVDVSDEEPQKDGKCSELQL